MKLAGKVALVTGGSRGIGRAIARALAADGAAVAVNFNSDAAAAASVVDEIKAENGEAYAFKADVSDEAEAGGLVEEVLAKYGELSILVNNAGVSRDKLIYQMTAADWQYVMHTNFGGVFNCTRACLDHFMRTRDKAIVNVSSVMGQRGWIGESNYAASKGAIDAFTRCAALELARFGVRVNSVLPGFVPTELVAELASGGSATDIKRQIPMRDFATSEQVAAAVRFLAGPESSYMTGASLNVDGGGMAALGLGRVKW